VDGEYKYCTVKGKLNQKIMKLNEAVHVDVGAVPLDDEEK
jgi:hypothetical protein